MIVVINEYTQIFQRLFHNTLISFSEDVVQKQRKKQIYLRISLKSPNERITNDVVHGIIIKSQ